MCESHYSISMLCEVPQTSDMVSLFKNNDLELVIQQAFCCSYPRNPCSNDCNIIAWMTAHFSILKSYIKMQFLID